MDARLKRVSVVIPSWNGRTHLETCLAALAEQTDPGVTWETLVLDNGSRDGTTEWILTHHPAVRVLTSPVNLGFAGGITRLVAEATGDAIALLNNDTLPPPDWLATLVDALAAAPADVAAVAGATVDWHGERLDFGRGVMTFDGHAFQLDFGRPLDHARLPAAGDELLFACGANMLVRRQSLLAAGGFDDDYFACLEDVDLGWRLWSGGERVLAAPAAVVRHRSSATSDSLGVFNRGFLFERNAWLTVHKNYETGWWERLMPAVMLTFLSRAQALLRDNNPGGRSFAVDPYAGGIADTAGDGPVDGRRGGLPLADLGRRTLQKLPPRVVARTQRAVIVDPRTVAELRVANYLLGHLDRTAEKRAEVQARRRRPDREIFERFPLYLVPTYPGDEELFAGAGFAAWLPADLPLIRTRLDEIMEPAR